MAGICFFLHGIYKESRPESQPRYTLTNKHKVTPPVKVEKQRTGEISQHSCDPRHINTQKNSNVRLSRPGSKLALLMRKQGLFRSKHVPATQYVRKKLYETFSLFQ